MEQRRARDEVHGADASRSECSGFAGVTVMAASCLWQDLREGLEQAELLCSGILGNRESALWCGRTERRLSGFDVTGLPLRNNAPRGGETT